jgi:predicted nuclease of predicted toxin-antitoxin system
MLLLFDQNISFRVSKKLVNHFKDCKHVSDVGLANQDDLEIWKFAQKNDYTIVTFDSDFYDLSLIQGFPPKIIWIRSGNLSSTELLDLLIKNQQIIHDFHFSKEFTEHSCLELYFS